MRCFVSSSTERVPWAGSLLPRAKGPALLAAGTLTSLLVFAGCDGCSRSPPEPLRFVPRSADAVIEVRDIGVLAKHRAALAAGLAPFVDARQLEALVQELELLLGFDPTKVAGLAAAGLPRRGPLAAAMVRPRGRREAGKATADEPEVEREREREGGLLAVVPVSDRQKFARLLGRLLEQRGATSEARRSSLHSDIRVAEGSFGEESFTLAAWAFRGGMALVGFGATAERVVEEALELQDDGRMSGHPEHAQIARDLGADFEVRWIAANGLRGDEARRAARRLTRTLAGRRGAQVAALEEWPARVRATGLSLAASSGALRAKGRVLLDPEGVKRLAPFLAEVPESPESRRVLSMPGAIVRLEWALSPLWRGGGDEKRLLGEDLAPLSSLTGRGAAAVGLEDLRRARLEEFARGRMLWFGAAAPIDRKDAQDGALEASVDRLLESLERTAGVRGLGSPSKSASHRVSDGVLYLASDDERLGGLDALPADTALLGEGHGLAAELRFQPLTSAARSIPSEQLPLFARGIVDRVVGSLEGLEAAQLVLRLKADGAQMDFSLRVRNARPPKS